jgi:enamine deaminase RidA (YjgF/YER057c/UK114 family)
MTDQQPEGVGSLYGGVPYDYGAVAPGGALLFTAGACPLDADGNVVGIGDPVTQARVSLDNLTIALDRYGARLEDLVKTTVYVVGDRQELVAVWEVVADGLAPSRPPSTLLGVSALGYSGQLVEIEGVAALPDRDPEGDSSQADASVKAASM